MKTRKPKTIEAGKCYRLNMFGMRGDAIAYVHKIEGTKQRFVRVEFIGENDLGWRMDSYTGFLRRVHSEEPTAKN
jgi:hypothetical protein